MNPSATSLKPRSLATSPALEAIDPPALLRALELFATHEAQITQRLYVIFFDRRPNARELFGAHSIGEREEMLCEMLRSLYALYAGEVWLEGNLLALGKSHCEYGVTEDMYASFSDCLIDGGQDVLGDEFDEAAVDSLRAAMARITKKMKAGSKNGSA